MVVTEKQHPQPGFDPHVYVSLATYYWPDPAKPDGLPYISRDGERNPETEEYDHHALGRMEHAVHNLAQAWYFTGEKKYADGAVRQLRAWFLDPATKMNPNLNHGQMVKGKDTGRGTGIIDTHGLPALIDDILLLHGAPGWTPDDEQKLRTWCRDYLTWLRTSKIGKKEAGATNNHGMWYDAQCAALALFAGDRAQAKEILESTKTKRIATQIEPDGSQPLELKRTLSISYTFFNLEALFTCARLGEHVGVDLWNFRTADGRGLRAALEWTAPYALQEKKWENKQIHGGSFGPLYGLLRRASVGCREPAYELKAVKIEAKDDEKMWVNFYSPPTKK
ncbi:MAG: alginate lyase family protein [Kiritimatiellaeota bacterium]|nr:alginate lyase family protein [Kiritimatiellota bacterium]